MLECRHDARHAVRGTHVQHSLGSRLRQLREARRLSLRNLEDLTGLSNGYLSLLENDKVKQPKPPVLHKLAEALDVPYIELMGLAGYLSDRDGAWAPSATPAAIMFKGAEHLNPDQHAAVQQLIDVMLTQPHPAAHEHNARRT